MSKILAPPSNPKYRRPGDAERMEMLRLYGGGMTQAAIGQQLGCTQATVYRALARYGVTTRTHSDYPIRHLNRKSPSFTPGPCRCDHVAECAGVCQGMFTRVSPRTTRCSPCQDLAQPLLRLAAERSRNADRAATREKRLLANYGLTIAGLLAIIAADGGVCLICGEPLSADPEHAGRLDAAVDHDHGCCPASKRSCGACIRGVLHSTCNRFLGGAEALGFTHVYLEAAPERVVRNGAIRIRYLNVLVCASLA